jgi:hypothetical protein
MILGCGLMPKDWLGNFFNLAYREVILPAARDRGAELDKIAPKPTSVVAQPQAERPIFLSPPD